MMLGSYVVAWADPHAPPPNVTGYSTTAGSGRDGGVPGAV